MPTNRIFCIGAVNIDRVYLVSQVVSEGEAMCCNHYKESWGGKGLNQAIALHYAGADSILCAKVGNNDYLNLCGFLGSKGIATSHIFAVNGYTNHGVIQVTPSGKTAIIGVSNREVSFSESEVNELIEDMAFGDILILQNEIDNIPYIMRRAKDKGLTVVLNPSPLSDDIRGWPFDFVDLLVLNEVEGKYITGKENTDEILASLQSLCPNSEILLTLGEDGCVFQSSSKRYYQPCFKVKTIDTIGAGDTFEGFFIARYFTDQDIPRALAVAAKAASIVVSKVGAAEIIPRLEEVVEQM